MARDELDDVLKLRDLEGLRRSDPEQLFRHLDEVRQTFLFGVEDRSEEEDEEGERWGGDYLVRINRNLALHLAPGFRPGMESRAQLPQFCVMPDEDRADQAEEFQADAGDAGEQAGGVIFWVDPYEYDVLAREAEQIASEYRGWDLIPDSYFIQHELVRFITRTVLDHPAVRAEREYDFRFGMFGGVAAPPLDDEEMLAAEDLIGTSAQQREEDERAAREEDDDEGERRDEDDEDEPPLEGMRSHPVQWS